MIYSDGSSNNSKYDYIIDELDKLKKVLNSLSTTGNNSGNGTLINSLGQVSQTVQAAKQNESTMHVPKGFKELLESASVWEAWQEEMKLLNDWMTPDGKDRHAKYLQRLLDEAEYIKALKESFLKSVSKYGPSHWDSVITGIEASQTASTKNSLLAALTAQNAQNQSSKSVVTRGVTYNKTFD